MESERPNARSHHPSGTSRPRSAFPEAPGPGKRTLTEARSPHGGADPVPVQAKLRTGGPAEPSATSATDETAKRGVSGAGGPLPHRDLLQRAFGRHDVSGIQAHVDDDARRATTTMGADAFARGDRVAFAAPPGLHTAAHEAAHVVQQRAGVDLPGGVGRAGDRYEQHADAVADAVVAGRSAEALLDAGPAGAAGSTRAVQCKVQINQEEQSKETLENTGIAKPGREQAVLAQLCDSNEVYGFDDQKSLKAAVQELATTDWGPREDTTVGEFARARAGKHYWASDNRKPSDKDLRVSRTNTLGKLFKTRATTSQLPGNSHPKVRDMNDQYDTTHVYSAMLTSLSPAATSEDKTTANRKVHEDDSGMNCEQFVAYSLWGGGVIQDWELKLLYAACAHANSMALLYQAMGFDTAELVDIKGGAVPEGASVIFEFTGDSKNIAAVAHMLVYTAPNFVELNMGKKSIAEWRVREIPNATYKERHAQANKCVYACPVGQVRAAISTTITSILDTRSAPQLLGPKHVDREVTEDDHQLGFLKFQKTEL